MKADEIRKWHKDLEATALNPTEIIRARARIEIAAQLAELNEFLRYAKRELTNKGMINVMNWGSH